LEKPGKNSVRYIIRSTHEAVSLDDVVKDIEADPGIELLDLIGPAGQPHTAVVSMPQEKAAALEQRYRTSNKPLTIEPDRPLSLFGED
jgi:hypothetical protein